MMINQFYYELWNLSINIDNKNFIGEDTSIVIQGFWLPIRLS